MLKSFLKRNIKIEISTGTPTLKTLKEYAVHYRDEFTEKGWHVYEDDYSFGIATKFKTESHAKQRPS